MPEETCVEVNCCPLGYTVPGLGGTLALAGDDSTATDPRVVAGEFIFAEEAKLTRATLVGSNPNIVVNSTSGIQQGYAIECIGVYKDIVATLGSYDVTVPDVAGLKIGQLIDSSEETITAGNFVVGNDYKITSLGTTDFTLIGAPSNTEGVLFTATGVGSGTGTANYLSALNYFAYGTVITNIVGLTVTLSNPALGPATTEVLFRPVAPPLIVGSTVVIPSTLFPSLTTATTVTNIAGTTLTLSATPTASMTKALVSFFPAELDPNVFDEAQLFT
jgi:hypothetical protein